MVHRGRAVAIAVVLLALMAACGGGTTELTTADLERADAPARRSVRTATSLPAATTTTTEQPPGEDDGDAEDQPATPQDPAPPQEEPDDGEVAWRVVVDEPTIPDEPADAFADIITEREDLGPVWARFGLQATFVDVHLDRELLLVAGFGESSSCPRRAHALEVAGDTVTLRFGNQIGDTYVPPGETWDGGCTADYRARTLVLAVEHRGFPEGALAFVHDGEAFSLATLPLQAPPPAPAPPESAGPQLDVSLVADPTEPTAGQTVALRVVNRSDRRLGLDTFALDRWESQRWRPTAGQESRGEHPAVSVHEHEVEPGHTAAVAEVDTGGLGAGWYAARVRIGGGDGIIQHRRAVFELR